jgi:hypothetical protein
MLNYFAQPRYWSWGSALPESSRWSLIAGITILLSVIMHRGGLRLGGDRGERLTGRLLLLNLFNATIVLLLMSYDWQESWRVYVESAKFVMLYFLVLAAVETERDFRWLLGFLTLGMLYWGIQAKFGQIQIVQGRLENFGGPGCDESNELASIVVTLLPIIGATALLMRRTIPGFWSNAWIVALASGIVGLNVLLLCNSRGGFLGLIGAAAILFALAQGQLRRKAIMALACLSFALYMLLGNPQIMERFLTTFDDKEEAQQSIDSQIAYANRESRMLRWKAGLAMLRDYPFGSGGGAFRAGKGEAYLAQLGPGPLKVAVHQGFIRVACDWGVQGLLLHLSFMAASAWCAWKALRFQTQEGDVAKAFMGICILASMTALLITCFFGDLLHLEWGYWVAMLAVLYGRIYGSGMIQTAISPGGADDGCSMQAWT